MRREIKKKFRNCLLLLFTGFLLTLPVFANAETIKSATEFDYPPFSVKTEDGKAGGFSVELLKATLSKVGLDADFYIDSWSKIKDDLKDGKIQVLPLVGRTPEREAIYDFTVPYISLFGGIFTRVGEDSFKTTDNLKGREIIVMKGDNAEEYVKRKNFSEKIILTDSYEEAFKMLSEGKGDAIISQEIVGFGIINKEKIYNIVLSNRIGDYKQDFTFAVKEGDTLLLSKLNDGLSKIITDGTYDQIYKKWFNEDLKNKITKKNETVEELSIKLSALETANQIEEYLKNNPTMTIKDLQNDPVFTEIAVQKIGETGYTTILDANTGYFYLHPQKKLINTDAHALKDKLPELWSILSKSIGENCSESSGYYKWTESDDSITEKYMYLACAKQKTADGKTLLVPATNYINKDTGKKYLEQYNIQQSFVYAKNAIRQKGEDVAKQIEIYLLAHPEKTIADLQADEYFQKIAVQPIGKSGYTAVTEYKTLINRFHKNPKTVNTDLSILAEKLPGFWNIISKTREGGASEGTYDWQEADGSIRQKYMYVAPVNASTADKIGLNVAATTYLDEYSSQNSAIENITENYVASSTVETEVELIKYVYWLLGLFFFVFIILFILKKTNVIKVESNFILVILTSVLLLLISVFILNAFQVTNKIKNEKTNDIRQVLKAVSEYKKNYLERTFKNLKDKIRIISEKKEFIALFENPDDQSLKNQVNDIIEQIMLENIGEDFFEIDLINSNGIVLVSTNENSIGQNVATNDYFIYAAKDPYFDGVGDYNNSNKGYINISRKIYNKNDQYIGVIDYKIGSEKLLDIITLKSGLGETGESYLINLERLNITPLKFKDDGLFKTKISTVSADYCLEDQKNEHGNYPIFPYPSYHNSNAIGVYAFIPDIKACLITERQEMEISRGINREINSIWYFTFGMIIVIIPIGLMLNTALTNTLKKEIKLKTEEIEKNNVLIVHQLENEEKINKEKEHLLEEQKISKEQLQSKNKEIEKVLSDIKMDKADLEKQRMAILNILEDVNRSGEELKQINDSLEKKKTELEALRSLGIELTSVLDLEEAVKIFCIYLAEVIEFDVATYTIVNLEDEGGLIYMAYLNQEVSEKYLNTAQDELLQYLSLQKDFAIKKSANIIRNIKPHFFGKKLNNSKDFALKQKISYPLMIGSSMLGVIQLTSRNEGDISNRNTEFIEAMLSNFSLSISRLQTIVRSQNSRTGSLIESLSDGVIMFNSEKNIVLMNPRASVYTGIPTTSPAIEDVYNLFVEYDIANMINKSLFSGETSHLDEIMLEKNYYELFIIPVKDVYGKIVGGAIIFHDITSLKKIDKMKTEFVSVASHQLRTPLTAIKLFTDMLIREEVGKLNQEQAEYLSNVHESTERMVRLVNDLLNVTRIESGRLRINPEPLNVKDFIEGIIAEAKPLAKEKNTKIISSYDPALPIVPLDQNLMRQVIQNLLVNAIRYAHEKDGTVTIDVKKNDEEFFTITVKDNGIGIPLDVQDRIFEKFFRANNAIKSVTEGTGLGLYVSKMIVESSGGKVWFESKDNLGTTFFVKLPIQGMKEQKGERGLAIS